MNVCKICLTQGKDYIYNYIKYYFGDMGSHPTAHLMFILNKKNGIYHEWKNIVFLLHPIIITM